MDLPITLNLSHILAFLEYLYAKHISARVIKNYLSSNKTMATAYNLDSTYLYHHAVNRYLRSISINTHFSPTPRGVFDLITPCHISVSCDILSDHFLFRDIFHTSFLAFLIMSNIAPHSAKRFDPCKHTLSQDLIFAHSGAHLVIKSPKTLQDHTPST